MCCVVCNATACISMSSFNKMGVPYFRCCILVSLVLLSFFDSFVESEQSFLMQLNKDVSVIDQMETSDCFKGTASSNFSTNGAEKFVLSRGLLESISYETINPLANGSTTVISMQAVFQCCHIFCEKFARFLNNGKWISGRIDIDVVEESTVGIYYKNVQVCHKSYLEGVFGQSVLFSPFSLEGGEKECLVKKNAKHVLTYIGLGDAKRVSAVNVGTNSITVYFGFAISSWSKNFMLTLMREGEHGTLTNFNAAIYVRQEEDSYMRFGKEVKYFGAVALFGYFVVVLSVILLICTRSKRVFLEQTWKTYDAYLELNMRGEMGYTNAFALRQVLSQEK